MTRSMIGKPALGALLLISLVALMTMPTACSKSASGTTVSLYLADRSVSQGDNFSVDVTISTDTPCRGAQFALSFDPALMKCDGVSEGTFFKGWADTNGVSTLMIPHSPAVDNSQGHVEPIGIAVIGGSGGGAKGSGVLCTYQFTALGDGTAEPTLSDVVVADDAGQSIPDVRVNN